MEQLTQNLKDGYMQLLEVPFPALNKGCVLVRNHFSVISAGTEGKTVKDARLGYLGKAKARKAEVEKVVEAAKTHGLVKTYAMVMNKLESPSPLGYSCAGGVIAVADDVLDFKVGDRVACGGGSAVHAEVVAVPKNLCAKIPSTVETNQAAFATLGAIALQGIRQADLRLGENCVVIGLGIIGQLTLQMLKAGGIKGIGIDLDKHQVKLARDADSGHAYLRDEPDLEKIILELTGGHGTDAVIIAAGTSSLDPIDLAGSLARKKGKVIVVGAVPTGFDRKNYFRKELDLRMSSSYGPGRYDADYEEKGHDYPIGYVRWTENRNMQAFLGFLKDEQIDLTSLVSHTFAFNDAKDAYQMIVDRSAPFSGIVLEYDTEKEVSSSVKLANRKVLAGKPNIGFIGAGAFAQNFLLPSLKGRANLINVATSRSNTAKNVADKFGFNNVTTDGLEVIGDPKINTIFIATRHHLHAEYVVAALKADKNVFVEKPLCMNLDELANIQSAYEQSKGTLTLGFNRRFSPLVVKLKNEFSEELQKAINYRINAGVVPPDHWVHDLEIGGGRIIGEACHFIDLCMFLAGSSITSVSASAMDSSSNPYDTFTASLEFANGSVATVSYFSNGSKKLPKESLEVFCGERTAIIDDFKSMTMYDKGTKREKLPSQDKGHAAEVEAFLKSIQDGGSEIIPFSEAYLSTLATFKILESLQNNGARITVD